jgi:hydrogenase nickel incorporation protein HypB
MKIVAAKKILKANEQLAAENRSRLDAAGVFTVNLVGSPGCGKTTLLEALFGGQGLAGRLPPAVIEGDIAGSIDAQRMEALGVPVVQINTEGACHLDASMVAAAAEGLGIRDWGARSEGEKGRKGEGENEAEGGISPLLPVSPAPLLRSPAPRLLVIENVGNLVCTAGFDLGEHVRIVVLSVAEGDDKLVKYPAIFQTSHALVVTKIDLLPHTNFRIDRVAADMKRLAPAAPVFQVSALQGEGIPALAEWLLQRAAAR